MFPKQLPEGAQIPPDRLKLALLEILRLPGPLPMYPDEAALRDACRARYNRLQGPHAARAVAPRTRAIARVAPRRARGAPTKPRVKVPFYVYITVRNAVNSVHIIAH